MCDDHGDPFIATLHSVLLAPESKNLVRLVLWTTDKRNGYLENGLDVDLKIT